jgi:hypothetical protein
MAASANVAQYPVALMNGQIMNMLEVFFVSDRQHEFHVEIHLRGLPNKPFFTFNALVRSTVGSATLKLKVTELAHTIFSSLTPIRGRGFHINISYRSPSQNEEMKRVWDYVARSFLCSDPNCEQPEEPHFEEEKVRELIIPKDAPLNCRYC